MKLSFIAFFAVIIFLSSCGQAEKPASEVVDEKQLAVTGDRQLNINILWDLSDRIDSLKNSSSPQHYKKDIEIITTIAKIFKGDMQKKGTYKAKGKLRVFFTPSPEDNEINTIAGDLSCDLSSFAADGGNKKKKEAYDSLEIKFARNTARIYNLTVQNNKAKKQWPGSDIWSFFKNDVKDYCIDESGNYRNILVILTDGYIYHRDSKFQKNHRTSFILPETLKVFRGNPKWKELFEGKDYGLIATRNDLTNLEILVLEISPSQGNKQDEDFIKTYLEKWFTEMGVKKGNYSCYNSALPRYTSEKINKFFQKQ